MLATTPPHILFFIIDDLGSSDLGLHGSGILTPWVDRLASKGILLENYYVLPYCSATRASFLSGRYPLSTGCHQIVFDDSTYGLPTDEETIAQLLSRAGYQCHAVGKWHIGHAYWEQTPTFRGFQSFYGFYHGQQDYFTHIKKSDVMDAYEMHNDYREFCGKGCSLVVDERGNYSTHVFTREATRIIQEYNPENGPLFLYLAHQAVHWPDEVPSRYRDLYQNQTEWTEERKTYAGMLTAADESLGIVVRALKQKGMWNNTLLLVSTDNGGPTDVCMVQGSSNYPRRAGKCTVYEGGTRGDAFLSGPALHWLEGQNGLRYSHLFHAVDWLPTLAELAEVDPAGKKIDGVSHWTAFQSHEDEQHHPPRREIYIGYANYRARWYGPAIRWNNWKMIQGLSGGPETPSDYPIAPDTPKKISGPFLLYDLASDPEEEHDVSKEFPEIVQLLQAKLQTYHKNFVPPIPNDPTCPFQDPTDVDDFGPTWMPWCKGANEIRIY